MTEPIPNTPHPEDWSSIEPIDDPLIEVTENEYFAVEMKYFKMQYENATKKCYMRKKVYDMLNLPRGIRLKVFDAWRPFALQKELYEKYNEQLLVQFSLQKKSFEEQKSIIGQYVSYPVNNPLFPPVHTTGGAVDVTLVDENGNELNMGTEFDAFSQKAHTAYFETSTEATIKMNRRMLYYALTKSGFTNLPSEWWHYDFGNRFWGYYNKRPALYTGIFTERI